LKIPVSAVRFCLWAPTIPYISKVAIKSVYKCVLVFGVHTSMAKDYVAHQILPGLLIFQQKRSPYWSARIRVNKGYINRSTREKSKGAAIEEALALREKLLRDPNSLVSGQENTFAYWAERLITKEKQEPPAPSGNLKWKDTERILNREKGLLAFFGTDNIKTIDRPRIEDFLAQMQSGDKPPSKWTQRNVNHRPRHSLGDHTGRVAGHHWNVCGCYRDQLA